jgi:hypothetical protein
MTIWATVLTVSMMWYNPRASSLQVNTKAHVER